MSETNPVSGKPVAFVKVPPDGVPSAPPLVTNAPAEPTLTPNAVATPVPKPDTLATATKDAVAAVPSKDPVNPVDVTEAKPASVVEVAPNAVEVLPIVILELTKFELATVVDAISPPTIVASKIIAEVTLLAPIAATPAEVIVISPPVTLANIELEKYGSNDPESTVNVLATLPS